MNVTLEDGRILQVPDKPVGAGGMGTGYVTADGKHFAKLFHRPSDELREVMQKVLGDFNCTHDPDPVRERYWSSLFLWPWGIVKSPGLGVATDAFPKQSVSLASLITTKRYAALQANAKQWNLRVLIAWKLAQAIARMHQTGVAHSDLSPNNVICNPATGELYIIDIDGLVVPGHAPSTVIGTPGYIAPEVLARRGQVGTNSDKHALATLIYQLLLWRHPLKGPYEYGLDPFEADEIEARQLGEDGIYIEHPTDTRNRPPKGAYSSAMLGNTLRDLMLRSFTVGLKNPAARPQAGDWKIALGRLLDRLVTCTNPSCVDKYYPIQEGRTIECPWCPNRTKLAVPGGLPVLRIYESGFKGWAPVQDFWIAGYPGRTIHSWHVTRGSEAGPFEDQAPVAMLHRDGAAWQLENLACPGLSELDGKGKPSRPVAVGDRVDLKEGMIFGLGDPATHRAFLVQWIK